MVLLKDSMVRITNIQMSDRLDNGTKSYGGERPTSNSDNSVPRTSTSNDVGETDSTGISDSNTPMVHTGASTVQNWYEKESLLKFVTPASISLIGMSNCGKSSYIRKMLEQADGVFTEPPSRVIYCYNVFQRLFTEMADTVPHISFYQGLPDRATIESWASKEKHLM